MSRAQLTILTNICLIEDLETQRVVMQYRAPSTNRWSGYAFPGGHVENGESFAESVIREIYEETGLTIQNPQLVGIKNWPLDTGGRYIVVCYKATEFSGTLRSSDEGEVSWVQKDQIPNLDLAYDMLPLMEMMEAPDKSEFFLPSPYRRRLGKENLLVFYQITKFIQGLLNVVEVLLCFSFN